MATILPFDLARTRPGIRELMIRCRLRLDASEETGSWLDGDISPDLIRGYLPDLESLFERSDRTVADMAEKASLLSLSAIHEGLWAETGALSDFMDLQQAAVALLHHSRLLDAPDRDVRA